MNTHLQYAGLIFVLYTAILFFSKKKINTMENRVYAGLLIHTTIILILDIISRLIALNFPLTTFTDYLFKVNVSFLVTYPIIFSYYVFVLTSKKNIPMTDINENPNKSYFTKTSIILLIFIFITSFITLCLPIDLKVEGIYFSQSGLAMTFGYVVGTICVISWAILILRTKENRKNPKYIPVYVYMGVCVISVTLQTKFPAQCFVSIGVALMTFLIYHTIENPDVELIKKLNVAKKEADEANAAKTEFLSSMSHEIRTPLNAIVGFGQALAKEDISGSAKEEVQDILMASTTLLDIVNGILDISKIESNKIEIVNNEYESKKMLSEVISLINARIGSKPINFKVIIDENLPAVLYGDHMRVKQVMINLLTNAVKYTQEGRILFQVRATNNLDVCTLEIQVQDTGMGMTEEAIEQLFVRFQRFDEEKNEAIEGTGLGMAITKGLIELMNGDIKVKSKYGEGSTFTVTLDQKIVSKVEQEKTEEETTEIKAFNASSSKILVVDDNKINLKVAERLLREYQINVELVMSGSECIDKILDGNKYDLIFMDIMMPKMNGIEALENLKNIVGFKMPVVALTADVIAGMEEKYISKGFDDCLAKPIVEEELYYMLRKFLKEVEDGTSPVVQAKTLEQTQTEDSTKEIKKEISTQVSTSIPKEQTESLSSDEKKNEGSMSIELPKKENQVEMELPAVSLPKTAEEKKVDEEKIELPVTTEIPKEEPKIDLPREIELPTIAAKEEVVELPTVVEPPVVETTPVVEESPVVEEQSVIEEPKNEEPPQEAEITIEPGEPHTVELLKNNKIDVDAGLDLLKDMEMYEMTLEEFYNELQNKLTDLENFKNEGNMDDYAILAHALKTEARYVGCAELGDMAYEHELAGKDKNQDLVNQKFAELKTEANRIYEVVKKYFS